MFKYTIFQWILFFFSYCFFGWVWESSFVSITKRKLINRGFLHGPFLPIYGTGAIIILLLTLPVRENWALIFVLGMIGATLLEYFTGALMERIFHVRYWDYSDKPFNLNGHICLLSSLAWGGFSLLLVKFIHPPIEGLVIRIPSTIIEIVVLVLVIYFTVDVTKSVQNALNLKEILVRLGENNQSLARMEERLEHVVAGISLTSDKFRNMMRQIESRRNESIVQYQLRKGSKRQSRNEALLVILDNWRNKKSRVINLLSQKIDAAISATLEQLDLPLETHERTRQENILSDLNGLKEMLRKLELDLANRRGREYQKAVKLLKRNPSAVSINHSGELQEIKSLFKSKNKKDQNA